MQKLWDWLRQFGLYGTVLTVIGGFLKYVFRTSLQSWWERLQEHLSERKFEQCYLERVIAEHRYLPVLPTTLVPVNVGEQKELDRLYVSLSVRGETHDNVGLDWILEESSKLVILGEPGAGKTTALRFLALTFARARSRRISSSQERLNDKRKIDEARQRVSEEFRLSARPFPVFVYLNRLRNILDWPPGHSLLDSIRDDLKTNTLRSLPKDFLERKLRDGECIFLFDAFDELGSDEARRKLAEAVGQFASSAPPGNRFIITSRTVSYRGQLAEYGFVAVEIMRLTRFLIQQLVKSWFDCLGQVDLGHALLRTLEDNARIRDLAANPLLLSFIVLVQYARGEIPDRRHILYGECIKILVERRMASPQVRNDFNRIIRDKEAISLLQSIALAMHKRHLREIPSDELEKSIMEPVIAKMSDRVATEDADTILKNIQERSQLIVERGIDDRGKSLLAFSHMTFQEFLAARGLNSTTAESESSVWESLINQYLAEPEWWEEVALLYAAQLGGQHSQSFLQRLRASAGTPIGGN